MLLVTVSADDSWLGLQGGGRLCQILIWVGTHPFHQSLLSSNHRLMVIDVSLQGIATAVIIQSCRSISAVTGRLTGL